MMKKVLYIDENRLSCHYTSLSEIGMVNMRYGLTLYRYIDTDLKRYDTRYIDIWLHLYNAPL